MTRLRKLLPILAISSLMCATAYSYPSGSPGGYSGAPDNSGRTCTSCHGANQGVDATWISSDIPTTGYVAGTTYNITLNITASSKIGFELAAQNSAGTTIGTFIAGTSSKILSSGKYITQSATKSSPATWTFQWKAPTTAGSGSVTFYGAYAIAKSSVKTGILSVSENVPNSVETLPLINPISVYPNPSLGRFSISTGAIASSAFSINIYNDRGEKVESGFYNNSGTKIDFDFSNQPKGVYFIEVNDGKSQWREKIAIK